MEVSTTKGLGSAIKVCASLVKAVGPLLLSQFDYSKFKYLDFKTKQAQSAGYAEYLLAEARTLVEIKAEQTRESFKKTGLERLQSEQNIKLISKEINKLLVYSKVPAHISYPEGDKEPLESNTADDSIEINETWLDRFNDLASKLNEEWRQNILAKSFVLEAENPGTIGLDTLFTIAQLDQKSFYFFDAILSISLKLYEVFFLPLEKGTLEIIVNVNGTEHDIGNIIYQLKHTGLLIHEEGLGANLSPGKLVQFRYDNDVLAAIPSEQVHFAGIMTSRSGSALATLCTINPNEIGVEIFHSFEEVLVQNNSLYKRYSVTEEQK
ncbi:DUF2806 domain-containing protein [Pseudomonas yamanorum]|uniref:DUF2806 domain-containing protein n=1 Tax=Pseudomonas yamanorum TaxID=515393 RepID=UPI0009BED020|nr:DUF2806 domain-containing protein [Pseudomonas yamanorum]